MRTLALLVTLLAAAPQAATDQRGAVPDGTVISSAQVTGFDADRLSPGLQLDIRNLAGTPLKQERLDELATRIEEERPRYVAAVRTVLDPDGHARVFFVVARQGEQGHDENVNARYVVEHAEITGVPDADVPQSLRDDLQALVGKRLDSGDADRFQERVERELPDYEVSRRIQRGTEVGRIRLVFELKKKAAPNWIPFQPLRSNALYHSDQGWGAFWDLNIGDGTIRFTPTFALDYSDDLPEEYSGYGLRFETRKLGTRRLGASFEWSWYDTDWRGATLDAVALNPGIPAPYDNRMTITPLLKFAFSPNLSISGGVSISELEPLEPATDTRMANAVVGSIDYNRKSDGASGATHAVDASFGVHGGSRDLQSDLTYTRYLGQGIYRYDLGRHHVAASGMAGGITGDAPLFERFTLGDSLTLRGWDKYDIAPAGGDRVVYSSIAYRYTGVALFLDVGSVWDENSKRQVRVSAGFGLQAGPAYLTVGFPLNTDNLRAVFTMGLRITPGLRW
jgi:hypothetical protein